MVDKSVLESQRKYLEKQSALEVLAWAAKTFGEHVVLATSLGAEDQVLTHLIGTGGLSIDGFMLDTGRHFEETYEVLERTRSAYPVDIRMYFPDTTALEPVVNQHGPNFFRKQVTWRKQCCAIRKVAPLKRALKGRQAWITGLRRDQTSTRSSAQVLSWDEANGLVKINPLWRWTNDEVWSFIRENDVPYNQLHDKQFPSIGCQPCTRAVQPGEDLRAGRWWWELPEQKECGLHWENGRLVRANSAQPAPQPLFEEVRS